MNYNEGLPLRSFSEGALTKLQTMSWPGNIRQLRNAVEQILILGPYNSEIDSSELPETKQIDKNNTGNSVFEDEFINLSLDTFAIIEAAEIEGTFLSPFTTAFNL